MVGWVLLGAACTAVAMLVVPGPFARGMIVGAAIVMVFGGLAVLVGQFTGTASLGMGAQAEVSTASELRTLRRHGWRIANHLLLRFGDIDHLLVGPHGVLVVETKWSADGWSPQTGRFKDALRQVQRNARDVRLWRPELRHESLVQPVLFLWGGARSGAAKPDSVRTLEGVDVIYGVKAARQWRDGLIRRVGTSRLSEEQIASIWEAVTANARDLDRREQMAPAPPSIARMCVMVIGAFFAAMVALIACFYTFRAVDSGWWCVGIAAAYVLVGLLVRRWSVARTTALGWITGAGFAAAIALAVTLHG